MICVPLDDADRRASQTQTSRSQVIAAALAGAEAQEHMRLAAEGYRFYADEAREFAEAMIGILSCREFSEEIYSEISAA